MNKETIEKLFNVESFLVLGLIIFNILNLILFSKDSQALLVNSLILLCAYFGISKRHDKKVVLLSIIHFAFYGVIRIFVCFFASLVQDAKQWIFGRVLDAS